MYIEMNRRIVGAVPRRRRALPTCVVAGVRGLIPGDGTHVGFRPQVNPSNINVHVGDGESDIEEDDNGHGYDSQGELVEGEA